MAEGFRAASATVSVLLPTKAVARLRDECFKCQTMLRIVQTNNNLKGTSLYVGCSTMELLTHVCNCRCTFYFTIFCYCI